jgi:hypothetical protein
MFDVRNTLQPQALSTSKFKEPCSAGLTLHLRKVNLRIFAYFQLEQPSRCPYPERKTAYGFRSPARKK